MTRVLIYFHQIRPTESQYKNKVMLVEKEDINLSRKVVLSIMMYPTIQALCWLPFTFYRLCAYLSYDVNWLEGPRFWIADSQGFLNAIAYYVTSRAIER